MTGNEISPHLTTEAGFLIGVGVYLIIGFALLSFSLARGHNFLNTYFPRWVKVISRRRNEQQSPNQR